MRMSGALSQRSVAEADLGEFNFGALTFHCEVKGGGGVCERGTRGVKGGQKDEFLCFCQIVVERKKRVQFLGILHTELYRN